MEWATASSGNRPVGRPFGSIEDADSTNFLSRLRAGVGEAADSGSDFVLDLNDVDYVAASGLMAMTLARKEAVDRGIKIIIARPCQIVREVLEISRYQLIFDIVDDLELDG